MEFACSIDFRLYLPRVPARILILSFLALGSSFCVFGQSETQQQIDSLFDVCHDRSINDTIRAQSYKSLTEIYFNQNIDSVQIVCAEGIGFIKTAKKKTDAIHERSLLTTESNLLMNVGVSYYHLNKLDKAIEAWYMCRDIKEELGDKKGTANVLNNIANIQIDLGEMEKAEDNFNTVLAIQQEIEDSSGIARTYNTIGYIHRVGGNDSLALSYYEKSLEIRTLIHYELGMAACYNNIGFIYKKNENYQRAIVEYKKAQKIYVENQDQLGQMAVLNNLANCYFELGQYGQANQFGIKGYEMAIETKKESEILYLSEVLYKINKATGNKGQALKYYEEFIALRDTIDSKKNYKALINQEVEFEFKEKEKINELNREKEAALSELKHENDLALSDERSFRLTLISISVSVGLLVVIILLFLIKRQLKLSKAQQIVIEKQQLELEMVALRSQMNPHFLFNSLNSIKHYIIKNETELAAKYLTKFSRLVRLILENSNKDLISLTEELEALSIYLELEQLRFKDKFEFEINMDVNADFIQVPPLVIQPFVENAIWHGIMHLDGIGKVKIDLSEDDQAVKIKIWDNGVGRKRSGELKKDATHKKSMGMDITHKRLSALNDLLGIQPEVEITDLYDDN